MTISTHQLAQLTAGGDDYIRTKKNVVRGLALNKEKNPAAPFVVIVGRGPRIEKRARIFASSGTAVPTYVKRDVNAWELKGNFRATGYLTDEATIAAHHAHRDIAAVAGILFLEPQ